MFGPGISGGVPNTVGLPTVQGFPTFPVAQPFPRPFTTSGWWLVDSAGSNTYPYDTWAKAANLLATIAAIDVAGDTIYCASTGSETTAGAITWNWAGTATSPTRVISADKTSGAPPATVASGYTISVTGANNITSNGIAAYLGGFTVNLGSVASSSSFSAAAGSYIENTNFVCVGTGGSSRVTVGASIKCVNCSVKFSAAGQAISGANGLNWTGGSLIAGGTSPTNLVVGPSGPTCLLENFDLSSASSAINLSQISSSNGTIGFRNIQLPVGWSGSLNSFAVQTGILATLNNCDSAGTNYILHRQTQFGDIYSEITIVRSGGASDGTTPLSWKMVSLAASGTFPITALETGEFVIDNETTGSPKTVTVEVLHDSLANLMNNEVWLEVSYYGASGNPQGTLISSAMTDVLQAPAALTVSSATWTTSGLTNPMAHKASVTITPQLKGYFIAKVKLCKPGYTVYVDPVLTVS